MILVIGEPAKSGAGVRPVRTVLSTLRQTPRSSARRYAPVPRDMRAMLRTKTLLGETFVDLTPGTERTGSVPEGGTLPRAPVAPTVELDEIFRSFDEETRLAFQTWMQSR
jgi:phospholipid/cholesterol/gamma-HCH transport system substrate-binding protein